MGFRSLLTEAGQAALEAAMALAPREEEYLPCFQRLVRDFPPDLARAALETAILRRKAADKFPFAERLYLTREALEQATPYEVASHRATRFREFSLVADLGCSVGGDTIALAQVTRTLGVDRDPLRLAMARENLAVLGLSDHARLVQADLERQLPLWVSRDIALFFDPSRRRDSGRVFSVRDYSPPLAVIESWLVDFPALGVKISPGVDLGELSGFDAEVEFISLHGELKEAVLWFGPLRSASRRATVLPGAQTLKGSGREGPLPISQPRAYLYEPDPAVMRAGLVAILGTALNAAQLDPDIAYLTGDDLVATPFARVWKIEDWFPFGVKPLRSYLRERGVGRVVVKKRGSPIQPEELLRKLKLSGEVERIVFLTHLQGRPVVVVCFPPDGIRV